MVFKMNKQEVENALTLEGAQLFDPSQKKRPMKEWVQLPYDYKDKWKEYAEKAFTFVEGETKK